MAAQSALSSLRNTESPNRQLKHLNDSIAQLKESESKLKAQLETLKKQFEAMNQKPVEKIADEDPFADEAIPPTH